MADSNAPFWSEDNNWPDIHPPSPTFTLWLEFELWQDAYDPEDSFFSMAITLSDGRYYALNVWTYQFLPHAVADNQQSDMAISGKYLLPPDLFVARLDRSLLEAIVAHLIQSEQLRDEWQFPNPLDES